MGCNVSTIDDSDLYVITAHGDKMRMLDGSIYTFDDVYSFVEHLVMMNEIEEFNFGLHYGLFKNLDTNEYSLIFDSGKRYGMEELGYDVKEFSKI